MQVHMHSTNWFLDTIAAVKGDTFATSGIIDKRDDPIIREEFSSIRIQTQIQGGCDARFYI